MPSFLCDNQREWEEPGHLKFLNALQEDAGNNFIISPISSPWTKSMDGGEGRGEGAIYPGVKCQPTPLPLLNPHVCFHFYVMIIMIKGIEKSLVIFSFLNALQEDAGKKFSYLVPMNIVSRVGGTLYPALKCPHPPHTQPTCILSFLCNDQRDWEQPGHLKFLNALQEDARNNFTYFAYAHSQ